LRSQSLEARWAIGIDLDQDAFHARLTKPSKAGVNLSADISNLVIARSIPLVRFPN
jgi:hypothetical protein